ncbi:unnamed protein product [Cylicostephanus goldi]|uniref:WW domain-containing protein n=1 Tax=Cylicostephanus goldi TaxID=71465 RepID=A0A3P6TUT2_CYLGO|nr:unnamed protein product [Cylicostephanus goldi]
MHYLPPDQSPSESTSDLQVNSSIPEGWEEREDANGRTFYVNHRERTTHWERPSQLSAV